MFRQGGDNVSHYYTDNADMSHDRRVISFRFLGVDYRFVSDKGVFSKDSVDLGTRLLLENIDHSSLKGDVVDVGCGYGVIAIIIAKISKASLLAIDINSRAIELTKENAVLNNVSVKTCHHDGLSGIDQFFDTIITNPPIRIGKVKVYQLFAQAYEHLRVMGELWIVIRKQQGASSAVEELTRLFGNCAIITKKKGYWILKAVKA